MKTLLLVLALTFPIIAQTTEPTAKQLRDDYIATTDELISSLDNLRVGYEKSLFDAVQREAQARELLKQSLLPPHDYDKAYNDVKQREQAVEDVKSRLVYAKKERDSVPSLKEIDRMLKASRKRDQECRNWNLSAYQKVSRSSTETAFRFICKT